MGATEIQPKEESQPGTNTAPQNGELLTEINEFASRDSDPDICHSEQKLELQHKELEGACFTCDETEENQTVKMTRGKTMSASLETDRVTRSGTRKKSNSDEDVSGCPIYPREPIRKKYTVKPMEETMSVGERTSTKAKMEMVNPHISGRDDVRSGDDDDDFDEDNDENDSTDDKLSNCSFEGSPERTGTSTNTSTRWSPDSAHYRGSPDRTGTSTNTSTRWSPDSAHYRGSRDRTSTSTNTSPQWSSAYPYAYGGRATYQSFSDDEEPRKPDIKEAKQKSEDTVAGIRVKDDTEKENQKGQSSRKQTLCYRVFFFLCIPVAAAVSLTVWKMYDTPSVMVEENPVLKEFLSKYESLQSRFPGQVPWFWKRCRIVLQKHLNTSSPSEPLILMFVADRNTRKTLECISQMVADSYSSMKSIQFDGAGKQKDSSSSVKLDIDTKLSSAFEKGKKAAVIQNFQHLPPSSTLIFYKFCDHENAAYKNVLILLTILLEEEEELDGNISFRDLEDKVWNFLKLKFLTTEGPTSHDTMDVDKLSGLWSRISHVVLPVRPVNKFEMEGCE